MLTVEKGCAPPESCSVAAIMEVRFAPLTRPAVRASDAGALVVDPQIFWRAPCQSGSAPNDELVASIDMPPALASAFRKVDRAAFLGHEVSATVAYSQRPVRCGVLHHSAPSLYAKAAGAMRMHGGGSILVVGSGTGCA